MTGVMKSFKEMTLKMEMEKESQVGRWLELMCRGLRALGFPEAAGSAGRVAGVLGGQQGLPVRTLNAG